MAAPARTFDLTMGVRESAVRGLAFAGSLALVACAAVLGLDDARYGAALDASLDSATGDAPDSSDAAPRFCATVDATFCADFDGVDLDEGFNRTPDTTNGGHIDASTAAWVSPPRALVTSLDARDAAGGGANAASYVRLFTQSSTETRLRYYVQIARFGGAGLLSLGALRLSTARLQLAIDYNRDGGLALNQIVLAYEGGTTVVDAKITWLPQSAYDALTRGEWVPIVIHTDIANRAIDVSVGDASAQAELLPEIDAGGTAVLYLGTNFATIPHDGWAARFDDVVVEMR